MWEQTLAIFIVLGLLAAGLWLLRRKGFAGLKLGFASGAPGQRRLELLERMPLTPHHSLHVVRVEDRLVLIGISPSGCTAVDAFSAETNRAALSTGSASASGNDRQRS